MTTVDDVVSQFYRSVADADAEALLDTLTDDFAGHVTDGIPKIGGTYQGPRAMLEGAWGPAHRDYGVRPVPSRFLTCGDDTVVVLGRYEGRPPATGLAFTAEFAHVIELRDGKIAELRQITDSERWARAVAGDADTVRVVRQVFDAVRTRDLELLLDVYADDVVIVDDPALPYGGVHRGREGALAHSAGYADAWDDLQDDDARDPEEEIAVSAGGARAYWTLKAARGSRRFAQPAASLFELKGGKVTRLQMLHADTAEIVRFLDDA